jgi:hypothetical protein
MPEEVFERYNSPFYFGESAGAEDINSGTSEPGGASGKINP